MLRRTLMIAVFASAGLVRPAFADEPKKTPPTVAVFQLHGALSETPKAEDFPLGDAGGVSLRELVARMDKAAKDPAVKAVVLLVDGATIGAAQKEELRKTLARVRSAGKEIWAHADSLSMGDYALLCGSTRLSVVPTGDLWITGMYGEAPYLRGLLDKLGVQPDFMTCGAYKSAAELFMRRQQIE